MRCLSCHPRILSLISLSFLSKSPTGPFGGTRMCSSLFSRVEHVHRGLCAPLLISSACVLLRHLERVPPEDRHELVRCRFIVCGDCRASLSQTVSTVRNTRFDATIAEPIAEPRVCEWPPKVVHEIGHVATS